MQLVLVNVISQCMTRCRGHQGKEEVVVRMHAQICV
jgi:hypothetical protein